MLDSAVEPAVGPSRSTPRPRFPAGSSVGSLEQRSLMRDDIVLLETLIQPDIQPRALGFGQEANGLREDLDPRAGDDPQPKEGQPPKGSPALGGDAQARWNADPEQELLRVFHQ